MIKNVLWVDDLRDPDDYSNFNSQDVTWVKNSIRAFEEIEKGGYDTISLDNDLGEKIEGVDIFRKLEEYLFHNNACVENIRHIYIHTSNTSARRTMLSASENFERRFGVYVGILPSKFRKKDFV